MKASAVLSTTAAASVILFVILQPTKYWKTLHKLANAFVSSNASYYYLLLLPSRNSWPKHVTRGIRVPIKTMLSPQSNGLSRSISRFHQQLMARAIHSTTEIVSRFQKLISFECVFRVPTAEVAYKRQSGLNSYR